MSDLLIKNIPAKIKEDFKKKAQSEGSNMRSKLMEWIKKYVNYKDNSKL